MTSSCRRIFRLISCIIIFSYALASKSNELNVRLQDIFRTNESFSQLFDKDDYVPSDSDEHDHFTWELFKVTLQEQINNVMISPFSVKLVMALLSEAAGNGTQTQSELVSTLGELKEPDNLRGFYKKLLASLHKSSQHYTLDLGTKLFIDSCIEPNESYRTLVQNNYDTSIELLHFDEPLNASQTINDWCSNVTHGKLRQLVNDGNIRNNIMVLASAIYFKGLWQHKFGNTHKGVFFQTPAKQLKVDFMEITNDFYYHDSVELKAQLLRLPYKGRKFSMFVLLPKVETTLAELLHNLQNQQLKAMQFLLEKVKVQVTLPKFKFSFSKDLKGTLQSLGVKEIFTEAASLPGLSSNAQLAHKLQVSNVFQKTGIDVNEMGTEAFAATFVGITVRIGGDDDLVQEFKATRPFLFFIEEEHTGTIMFAGKVSEPVV